MKPFIISSPRRLHESNVISPRRLTFTESQYESKPTGNSIRLTQGPEALKLDLEVNEFERINSVSPANSEKMGDVTPSKSPFKYKSKFRFPTEPDDSQTPFGFYLSPRRKLKSTSKKEDASPFSPMNFGRTPTFRNLLRMNVSQKKSQKLASSPKAKQPTSSANSKSILASNLQLEKIFTQPSILKRRRKSCCCEWCGGISKMEKRLDRNAFLNMVTKRKKKSPEIPVLEPQETISGRKLTGLMSKGKLKIIRNVNKVRSLLRNKTIKSSQDLDILSTKGLSAANVDLNSPEKKSQNSLQLSPTKESLGKKYEAKRNESICEKAEESLRSVEKEEESKGPSIVLDKYFSFKKFEKLEGPQEEKIEEKTEEKTDEKAKIQKKEKAHHKLQITIPTKKITQKHSPKYQTHKDRAKSPKGDLNSAKKIGMKKDSIGTNKEAPPVNNVEKNFSTTERKFNKPLDILSVYSSRQSLVTSPLTSPRSYVAQPNSARNLYGLTQKNDSIKTSKNPSEIVSSERKTFNIRNFAQEKLPQLGRRATSPNNHLALEKIWQVRSPKNKNKSETENLKKRPEWNAKMTLF